jgi:hypothetical protein
VTRPEQPAPADLGRCPGGGRESRLRKVAPGAADDLVSALAALPLAQVELVARLARQARRDERKHLADLRRQRKADARRFRHYDEEQLGQRNIAFLDAQGRRAAGDLEALRWLAAGRRHQDTLIEIAVDGLRARGYSDTEIGASLGYEKDYARQEVHRRYGRRNPGAERRSYSYTGPGETERSA